MTPSESIVAAAHATREVTDAYGRRLTIRDLTTLDMLRLFKAVGPDASQNLRYLGLASLTFAVQAIDGVPVPQPVNETQIEALVQQIGDVGMQAIADGLKPGAVERDSAVVDPGN